MAKHKHLSLHDKSNVEMRTHVEQRYPPFIKGAALYLYDTFGLQRMQVHGIIWTVFRIDINKATLRNWLYKREVNRDEDDSL